MKKQNILKIAAKERQGKQIAGAISFLFSADGRPHDEADVMLAQRRCANLVLDGVTLSEARRRSVIETNAFRLCKDRDARAISLSMVVSFRDKIKSSLRATGRFVLDSLWD